MSELSRWDQIYQRLECHNSITTELKDLGLRPKTNIFLKRWSLFNGIRINRGCWQVNIFFAASLASTELIWIGSIQFLFSLVGGSEDILFFNNLASNTFATHEAALKEVKETESNIKRN